MTTPPATSPPALPFGMDEALSASPEAGPPRLALRGMTKRFGDRVANDHVDLTLRAGEIHALLGENGAGKSTLVKMIYGVCRPDAGAMTWEGREVAVSNPRMARALGIGMVFQHFSLFDTLTVLENIALGLDDPGPMDRLRAEVLAVSARYGLALQPDRHAHTLSVGERQRVEIVRCLLRSPRLLIMDEPTSVLTPTEVETLFATLRRLAAEGRTILYISHKLAEIRALCDRATVLRAGAVVGACDPRAHQPRELAEMMIGGAITSPERRSIGAEEGEPRLVVRHLSTHPSVPFATPLRDVGFELRAGEILGVAGVAGNGQAELLAALSGEQRSAPDAVVIDGLPVGHLGSGERRALGLGFVPEERLGHGAVPELSLAENALLSAHHREGMVHRGMIHGGRTRAFTERVMAAFNVVARGHHSEARSLSGGNLQKFIIGREMLQKPRLLVVGQPTWGVDAGAAAAIHQALMELARDGAAVLVVSQDLDELFALADRVAVLFHGRLSEARPVHQTTVEEIGLAMGGLFGESPVGDEDEAYAS